LTRILSTFLAVLALAFGLYPIAVLAQKLGPQEREMIEAIRRGDIQITPELINLQKTLHPELKSLSNEQIRKIIDQKVKGGGEGGFEEADNQTEARPNKRDSIAKPESMDDKAIRTAQAAADSEAVASERFPRGLKRFGYDFFQNNQNAPGMGNNMPSLPEYILSPGDELQVSTWGRENQNQAVTLNSEGVFTYPPLQPMRLAGMRFEQAQERIVSELQKIHGLQASVTLGRLRSLRVFVLGEVVNPGSFTVSAGATVISALFQSGGIKDIGSLRAIQVRRGSKVVATLDLYDMLLTGNNRSDKQLLSGDVIFVPVAPIQIAVTGRVKRPAIYEVKPGTKVLQALDLAGGLASNAFKGRMRLDRIESHKRKVALDIAMEKVSASSNVILQDGDMLNVEEVLSKEFDVVYLKGNVNRPGRYEWKKGMTIKDVIPSAKDLKSETYFHYGHIKRPAEEDERALLLPFSLKDVFEKGAVVPLEPRDTVMVYSRYDIMDQPMVSVSGMVRKPGRYGFVDNMRVSDLVLAGGGLTIDAYLPEAQIFRILKVEESDSLRTKLIKVNLTGIIENPGDENNFELAPFDSLVVFPRSNFILPKKVTIYGAVKKEGEFELTGDMTIKDVISQAQGLSQNSYKVSVEVVRRSVQNDSIVQRVVQKVSLRDIESGRTQFNLQDGDGIYVREVVNSRLRSNVWMMGEFAFPGRYEYATGEKLSSVIRRAGGFGPQAYLRGAVFIRKSVKEQQLRHVEEIGRRLENQMQIMLERTTDEKERIGIRAAIEQRKGVLDDIRNAPYLGRVIIRLDEDKDIAGTEWDVTLENGDSLWVGSMPNTVSILGEVYSPTNVIYTSGTNTIGECMGKAGGVSEYGDYSNTYYVSPDGTISTPSNTPWYQAYSWRSVEPGGSIIVPPKGPKKDYLDVILKTTQVIYNLAVAVGVVRTLF
jgi:polysaccharide biosynthesis/export protein